METPRLRSRYRELLHARWTLMAALAAAALGAFVKITTELEEGKLDALDRAVLSKVIELRVPSLNGPAVDLTALGSATVLTLVVIIASVLFASSRDLRSGLQLVFTGIGGGVIGDALKHVLERQRPAQITRLVHVSSFSYPSGHSMASASIYLTLAILIARHLPNRAARVVCFAIASVLAIAIGGSRAYLGVHYPSDILAGLLLGTGWALLVSAVSAYLHARRPPAVCR
jgi:undecaprenyl-diphosphatase